MKNITKVTFALVATIAFSLSAFGQRALQKAEEAYDAHQYFDAINKYKDAYGGVPKEKRGYVLYKMGAACREINDYKGAEANLQKAIAAGVDNPDVYLQLAEVLKAQMKYAEAIVEFNNYKSKGGNAKRADIGVKSCELAQKWVDAPMRYKIENIQLLNSKQRDFAPCFSDKKYQSIYFTSSRDGSLGSQEINSGGNHYDIYESKLDKNGKWSTPVLLPPSVSTPVNEARAWVSKKGDMIFFTRCPEEKNKINKCGLYMAKKQGSTWGEATPLPFVNDSIQFGHPCLSADGTILYFTSKMAGGYGGSDIWYCTFNAKTNSWGQPKNAGPNINTEGTESYPSVSDDGKKFYFSSDYHPGLGGLDIFVTEVGAGGALNKPIENLKYPLNSSFDDFGIVFEGKKNRGYFSSNREGGKGDDDIWSFNLPPLAFNAKGIVISEGDPNTGKGKNEPVSGVKVKVLGSDGSLYEVVTGKDGQYTCRIKENTTYTCTAQTDANSKSTSHSQFLANKDQRVISTVGQDKSKDYKADFAVMPVVPNPRMPEVRYELGKSELLPESKDSLNYLYNLMNANPGIVVELNSHTDSRGDADKNMELSQARAQSCVDYLVKEKGISPARLQAKGYGKTMLLVTDEEIAKAPSKEEKEALHAKNRRTSFKILKWDFVDPNAPKNTPKPTKPPGEDGDEEAGE